jgi:hypothetical protein
VHAADIQDRDGGVLLLTTLFGPFLFLKKLFAGSACQGPLFNMAAGKILTQRDIEIVKRSGQAKGFVVLPERWIAERTIPLDLIRGSTGAAGLPRIGKI